MKVEKVYSPIYHPDIAKNLIDSPIWKKAYKEDELTDELKSKGIHVYHIKFDGLIPVQVTKIEKL